MKLKQILDELEKAGKFGSPCQKKWLMEAIQSLLKDVVPKRRTVEPYGEYFQGEEWNECIRKIKSNIKERLL